MAAPQGRWAFFAARSLFQFVRPGSVNRVLIEFSGTGACWDEESCRPDSSLYRHTAAGELFAIDEETAWVSSRRASPNRRIRSDAQSPMQKETPPIGYR